MDKISVDEFVMGLLERDVIRVVTTSDNEYLCAIKNDTLNNYKTFSLEEMECRYAMNKLFYDQEKKYLTANQIQKCVDILKAVAHTRQINTSLANRIYMESDNQIVYDLNEEVSVLIEPDNVEFCYVDEWTFRRGAGYKPQVEPNLDVGPEALLPLIKKHFNFTYEYEEKLFMLYLVLAYMDVQHYILFLYGEKGSSKSSTLKKVAKLIDPQKGNVIGMPKSVEDLQLRLHHNYFLGLDNLSFISTSMSDVLCQSVTGSEVARRKLFTNTEEIILDIKCLVAINSVSMIVNKSDLMDRALILKMKRLDPLAMKTEKKMWDEFDRDIPVFLGAIFNTIALTLDDSEDIPDGTKFVRLADYHAMALRVGRVLGMDDEEVTKLMWRNQNTINGELLLNDVLSLCILQFFEENTEYRGSVTDFLHELRKVAEDNNINVNLLPTQPQAFSRKLNAMKSNLAQYGDIHYKIIKRQTYKEIVIAKIIE